MHAERIAVRPVRRGLAAVLALGCVVGGTWWRTRAASPPSTAVALEPASAGPSELAAPFATVARTAPPPLRPPERACPAPRGDAPMIEAPYFEDSFVDHVLPSPTDARRIAVWSGSNLYVSYDAGASFIHVLEAENESLGDVAFDCYGHVFAAANGKLAIVDGSKLRWTALPHPIGDARVTLASGGPDIVVLHRNTRAALAVSHDLGATWEAYPIGPELEGRAYHARAEQSADGTIRATLFDEQRDANGYTDQYDVVDVRVPDAASGLGAPRIAHGRVERYGDVDLALDDHEVLVSRAGAPWQRVVLDAGDAVLVPGAQPAVLAGGVLYTIEGGRAHEAMRWPAAEARETLEPIAIDRANRVWGIVMRGGGDCDGTARPVVVGRVAR